MRDVPSSRIEDKKRFNDEPEVAGVPGEEHVETADVDEQLEEDPERVANRRDVPDTPENSYEARTEDE